MRRIVLMGLLFLTIAAVQLTATVNMTYLSAGLSDGAYTPSTYVAQLGWVVLAFPLGLLAAMFSLGRPLTNLWLMFLPNALVWAGIICLLLNHLTHYRRRLKASA